MIKYNNKGWKLGENQRGIVTPQDHPVPEKPSLGRTVLEATLLSVIVLASMYGCWKAYDYADARRRQEINTEKQGR